MIDTFYRDLNKMCDATEDLSVEEKCLALLRVSIERGFDGLGDITTLAMITKCLSITMNIMAGEDEDGDQKTECPDDWSMMKCGDATKH